MQHDICIYKWIFLSLLLYRNHADAVLSTAKLKGHGKIVRSGADRSIIQLNATTDGESRGDIADYAAA